MRSCAIFRWFYPLARFSRSINVLLFAWLTKKSFHWLELTRLLFHVPDCVSFTTTTTTFLLCFPPPSYCRSDVGSICNEWCLHFNVCLLFLLTFASRWCWWLGSWRKWKYILLYADLHTWMPKNDCYWMLIHMQKLSLNLIYAQMFVFFALMNVSSGYGLPFHANEFVFSLNEQQNVYLYYTADCVCKHILFFAFLAM